MSTFAPDQALPALAAVPPWFAVFLVLLLAVGVLLWLAHNAADAEADTSRLDDLDGVDDAELVAFLAWLDDEHGWLDADDYSPLPPEVSARIWARVEAEIERRDR